MPRYVKEGQFVQENTGIRAQKPNLLVLPKQQRFLGRSLLITTSNGDVDFVDLSFLKVYMIVMH
jgi:hypothetical protein